MKIAESMQRQEVFPILIVILTERNNIEFLLNVRPSENVTICGCRFSYITYSSHKVGGKSIQ